jgi:ribosome-binding protein aMBF1 (putative translation factor)
MNPPTSRNCRACPRCGGSGSVLDDRAVGAEMRARREKTGISLRELARRIKWSATYVSDLELGHKVWTEQKRTRYERGLR